MRWTTDPAISVSAINTFNRLFSTQINLEMPCLPQTQRALQFNRIGGPEVLEISTSAPLPEIKPSEILVKNTYSGVNYIDTVCPSPPSPQRR